MSGRRLGVRAIPSPFIKIYERGRDSPYPQPLALYNRVKAYLPDCPSHGPAAVGLTLLALEGDTA